MIENEPSRKVLDESTLIKQRQGIILGIFATFHIFIASMNLIGLFMIDETTNINNLNEYSELGAALFGTIIASGIYILGIILNQKLPRNKINTSRLPDIMSVIIIAGFITSVLFWLGGNFFDIMIASGFLILMSLIVVSRALIAGYT